MELGGGSRTGRVGTAALFIQREPPGGGAETHTAASAAVWLLPTDQRRGLVSPTEVRGIEDAENNGTLRYLPLHRRNTIFVAISCISTVLSKYYTSFSFTS